MKMFVNVMILLNLALWTVLGYIGITIVFTNLFYEIIYGVLVTATMLGNMCIFNEYDKTL